MKAYPKIVVQQGAINKRLDCTISQEYLEKAVAKDYKIVEYIDYFGLEPDFEELCYLGKRISKYGQLYVEVMKRLGGDYGVANEALECHYEGEFESLADFGQYIYNEGEFEEEVEDFQTFGEGLIVNGYHFYIEFGGKFHIFSHF